MLFRSSAAAESTTLGETVGKEAHRYIKIWIPLKNKIIQYQNGVGNPMKGDIGFCIVPYDSYGTLTTDNISSYAFNYKFYFKDP